MEPFAGLTPAGQLRRVHRAAASILARYGLGGARLRLLSQTQGVVYRVDAPTAGRFVLRISPPGCADDAVADTQLLWLKALAADPCLVVPTPVALPDGSLSLRWDDSYAGPAPRRCVLLRWVTGRSYQQFHTLSSGVATAIGTTIARLHTATPNFVLPATVPVRHWDSNTLVGHTSCLGNGAASAFLSPADYAALVEASACVHAAFASDATRSCGSGTIHADLGLHNFVFHHDEARPIDFDEWGIGPYLYDLAAPLRSMLALDTYAALRETLLLAYTRIRPIPQTAIDSLDAFVIAQCFGYLNWLFACIPRRSEWADDEVARIRRLLGPAPSLVRGRSG